MERLSWRDWLVLSVVVFNSVVPWLMLASVVKHHPAIVLETRHPEASAGMGAMVLGPECYVECAPGEAP